MTRKERDAITKALEETKNIFIPISATKMVGGKRIFLTDQERERLRNSEDFRKGWEMCHENVVKHIVSSVFTSNPDISEG